MSRLVNTARLVAILATISGLASCLDGDEHFTGQTMGPVVYNVTLVELPEGTGRDELATRISDELETVNRLMSTYRSDSDVSRFNESGDDQWFAVDPQTADVVRRSLEISRATDGAFDITVNPLVRLWNFGSGSESPVIPSPDSIDTALQVVGFRHLQVRENPPALRKLIAGLSIDLSAIAKGYAVDRVSEMLDRIGCSDYLVEVGGETRARGRNDKDRIWRLGIEVPVAEARRFDHRVRLSDRALATSGDYRNFYVVDGRTYSHSIDPRTGSPVDNDTASVSVVAGDCMTADAFATALMILGGSKARELAASENIQVLWYQRERGGLIAHWTEDFPKVNDERGGQDSSSLWPTFAAALIVFVIAILGMSVGVIFSNRRIKGSCGGLANLSDKTGRPMCEVCDNRSTCKEFQSAQQEQAVVATGADSQGADSQGADSQGRDS